MRVRCPFCGAETDADEAAEQMDCPACGRALSVLREAQTLTRSAPQPPQQKQPQQDQVETSSAESATVTRPQVRVNCFQCHREFTIPLGETDAVCPRCGAPYSIAGAEGGAEAESAAEADAGPDAKTVLSERVTAPPPADRDKSTEASLRWLRDHFEGRYEVVDFVSRGGMGAVFRVRQTQPAREVAMKVMLAGAFATETNRKRFEREAHAVARLKHPAIVPVYEFGEVGGQPYFTMEFVEGVNLRTYVAQHDLSREQICRTMVRVCDAIHYAHQHGVIHRDLKPGNIMVDGLERPRILDFGLSRATVEGEGKYDGLTMTGDFMGTPRYMSPEQAMGDRRGVDERTDVYALGVILYELIVGVLPYPVEHAKGLKAYEMIQKYEPLRPGMLHPNMPRDLELILLKAVQKDKEQRYHTAEELARDLENYLEDRPITARPTTISYRLNKWAWRRRRVLVPAITALLVVATVSFVYSRLASALRQARADTQETLTSTQTVLKALTAAQYAAREKVKEHVEAGRWREAAGAATTLAEANPDKPLLTLLPPYVRRRAERRVDQALADFTSLVREQNYAGAQDAAEDLSDLALLVPYADLAQRLKQGVGDFEETCWTGLKAGVADAYVPGQAEERIDRFLAHWQDGPHVEEARALRARQADLGTEHYLEQHARAVADALDQYRWEDAAAALESARGLLRQAPVGDQSAAHRAAFEGLQERLDAAVRPGNASRVASASLPLDLGGYVRAIEFAPDGSWFATASYPRRLTTWSWPERNEILTWRTEGELCSLAVSPGGDLIATGDKDGLIQIWSAADGHNLRQMNTGEKWVGSVQFTPDGTRILSATVDEAVLWNVASGQRLSDDFPNARRPAVLSPDAALLVAALPGTGIGIWEPEEPKPLFTVETTGASPADLRFSPDGNLLASAHTGDRERRVRLWDIMWGAPVMDVVVSPDPGSTFTRLAWGLAFSPDGRLLVTGDSHGQLKLWNVDPEAAAMADDAEGLLKDFAAHKKAVTCAVFSPDSRAIVTGGNDRLVQFWGTAPLPAAE